MSPLDQSEEIEKRIADCLSAAGSPTIVSAYLFGSQSEGRAHRESDIDVGVLMDRNAVATPKARFDASLRLRTELMRELATEAVDLVILNDAPPLFARRIVTQGRRIFCRDLQVDHEFVRDVQLRAADLQPFLDRMRKIKLEALRPR